MQRVVQSFTRTLQPITTSHHTTLQSQKPLTPTKTTFNKSFLASVLFHSFIKTPQHNPLHLISQRAKMIQELFGGGASLVGGGGGGGERKVSFNGILEGQSSPFTPNTTTTAATTVAPADQENLRCPRCDSSNTKFCYYNNYNLTQPRHFCKTCRRYWTKGGALRNVPIGGGCRKNKGTSPSVTAAVGKAKTATPEFGKSNLGFDLEAPSNQLLWASPQTSHLMALLRAAQNQNPNPNSNSEGTHPTTTTTIKEERPMIGSYNMGSESALGTTSSALNARPISVDLLSQVPVGLCNSFWRNNQYQQSQHQNQQHSFLMGDHQQGQSTGIQELFQRLRSSGNYYSDHSPPQFNNSVISPPTSTTPSSFMEPSPITAAEVGYWNNNNTAFSWANLPATNGAFP